MAKNRAEYRSAVRVLLNESHPNLYTDDDINWWLNDGQRDIAVKAKCIEGTQTITTVGGTQAYAFTGITCISLLYSTSALLKITPRQIGHIQENGLTPQFWYEWNNYAYICPSPTIAYTITALTAVDSTDMDYDTAESNLPIQFRDLIILYATYRGLIKAGKFAQAQQVYSVYIRELSFHQTNDAAEYREPEDFSTYKIPNKYQVMSQGKSR